MDNVIICINKDTRFECGSGQKYVIFKHVIVALNKDFKLETELIHWVLASYRYTETFNIIPDKVFIASKNLQDCFNKAKELGLVFY